MASTSTAGCQSEFKITNAFDGLALPSVFASSSASTATSSSSPLQKRLYEVFINHHGADVKLIMAKPIYSTLHAIGVTVFLDSEELEVGDFCPTALEEVMVSASLCIVIFSPGYAQSHRCLAKLSFLLKSRKTIIPVFYGVEPSDLRRVAQGKGMYANAFLEHQKKGYCSTDKLQEWKAALHTVSSVNDKIIIKIDDMQKGLKKIKNRVSELLQIRKLLVVAKHPVGLEEVVADFKMTVSKFPKTHSNVQIVGIWGMGGSGKTTLAKELFNQNYLAIERSSFIFDVKERELHEMQTKLLEDLRFSSQQIKSQEQGKNILFNHLKSVRVFIVLDDVEHIDQLDALLSGKDNLEHESLIIITTQHREVLRHWGISCIYEMKKMEPCYAKQLFCWHAFLESSSPFGFEELVEKFVSACNGLPLSLGVLGSQLFHCFNKDIWEDILQKISRIVPNDIKNRLKVSYDALDEEEKHMFVDVACFLIGEDQMTAIAVWEGSGWDGLCGWERLVRKCLVYLDSNNCIRMHDHLRDLGRDISQTMSPCRQWSPDQITNIQKQEEIRGMMMNAATDEVHNFPTFLLYTSIGFCGFRRTSGPSPVGLKIFVVKGNHQNSKHIVKLSRELAWLSWTESTFRNLPSWLPLKNLRVLELHSSQKLVSLWKDGAEAPVQLRVLRISDCPKLRRIPKSMGYLYNLKKIVIEGNNHLRKVDMLPTALEIVKLKDCKTLRNINGICDLVNLRELMLIDCPVLDVLPSFNKLASLEVLELTGVNNVEKIQGLQQCTSLEKLTLSCKCQEVPGVESSEQLQRLRRVELVAKKKAAVEPRIQTIQKWPEEIIICTKAVADAGSHLNFSAYPNLFVHSIC